MRVVIVTLDMHLARVVTQARASSRANPGLDLTLHAAAEWENNPAALERCQADIASADIVIATMLFLEDQIRAIKPALEARREQCDAMVVAMSAAELVKLTRMGAFSMDKPEKGLLALMKKLRKSTDNAGHECELRRRPARDAAPPAKDPAHYPRQGPGCARLFPRHAILACWIRGQFANMVRFLVSRYAMASAGRCAARSMPHCRPNTQKSASIIRVSRAASPIGTGDPEAKKSVGTVGVLLMRSYVLAGDTAHYDGVIAALEAKGLRAIPAFASGLDSRPAVEKFS